MLEEVYICWHQNQKEAQGRKLKAENPEAAAKTAVDIWRHEGILDLSGSELLVRVRDEENQIHEVKVHPPHLQ